MKDFYYILGVDADCTSTEIEEAYLKLSAKYNPETNANDRFFANRFVEIREAYEILSNRTDRAEYDLKLKKSRLNSTEERYRIKRYHSTTKGVNIGLTLVLFVLTFVFGYYALKAFRAVPAVKAVPALMAIKAPVHIIRHHKYKRIAKHLPPAKMTWSAAKRDTLKDKPVPTGPVMVKSVTPAAKPVIAATVTKPQPVEPIARVNTPVSAPAVATRVQPDIQNDEHTESSGYLYETYLKANQTGIVRLRAYAGYNAEVLANLPANAQVRVLERGAYYYKIAANNRVGYVPKWTVQDK